MKLNIAILFLAPLVAVAQTPMKGSFVMTEEAHTSSGQQMSTLAVLTFDGGTTVSGTEVIQTAGRVEQFAVFGSYDGSTIRLLRNVSDEDGPAATVAATYRYLTLRGNMVAAVRTDGAAAGLARLEPAATGATVTGRFVFAEAGVSSSGQSLANLTALELMADGSLRGAVSGSYTTPVNGIGVMRLLVVDGTPDEDGAATTRTLTYAFAVSADGEVMAIRLDNSLLGISELLPAR